MIWTFLPIITLYTLIVNIFGLGLITNSNCVDQLLVKFDVVESLQNEVKFIDIPVRVPQLPESWQPNSAFRNIIENKILPSSKQLDKDAILKISFITPSGNYITLIQSNINEANLVQAIETDSYILGHKYIGKINWTVYRNNNVDSIWATKVNKGPVIAITGIYSAESYYILANIVQKLLNQ